MSEEGASDGDSDDEDSDGMGMRKESDGFCSKSERET